ncbi:hypothetical protein AMK59_564 [Oryctes borbonicus]|uniref:Hamartin n=1 Tax=Oryctes borbonicus TaxID=1629725 RepID=A0A0T6B9T5_9SCAR|nr:hypothetical protein AMK59_564 [Oryctes borbonicus]
MAELLSNLESNDPKLVEESKQKFHEQFNTIKDPWLINGLYDTYLSSNSTRLMEVLVNVKEPHYTYLFDKISESIRSSKDNMKIQGLTLLGHIVRSQPAWMYKITSHSLMKDLLQLLKTETDILTLLSALMALIVLLPLIPSLMASYLQDVFDIFRRLAGWNCHETDEMHEEQTAHMQVALYALFLRLYGMYPCNFLAYLRDQFRKKDLYPDLYPIFLHTIKPMLDTVKMNPHLVTTSIANETSTERWKKIGAHDIIVECERFSLDLPDRCSHEQCFISTCRPKSTTSILNSENSTQLYSLKTITSNVVINDGDFFSPSMILHPATPPVNEKSLPTPIPSNVQTTLISSVTQISQESSSPPEAAIEATPETTPVRDNRMNVRLPPANSTIARAHTFAARTKPLGSGHNTPINSQPSSPMRKEVSPFNFQDIPRHTSALVKRSDPANRLQKLIQDRSQMGDANTRSPFMMVPTSPSKSLTSEMVSGSPMQRLDSPLSQEDEEVSQIVRQGETIHYQELRQCDSVLHEVEGFREL